jgi:hypothetical protein
MRPAPPNPVSPQPVRPPCLIPKMPLTPHSFVTENVVDDLQPQQAASLSRSKTTLNVPADARERIKGLALGDRPSAELARSKSSNAIAGGGGRRSPTLEAPSAAVAGIITPPRSLSIKKQDEPSGKQNAGTPSHVSTFPPDTECGGHQTVTPAA